MSIGNWVSDKLNLKPKPSPSSPDTLVADTYAKVAEVSALRESLLERPEFPIAGFIANRRPAARKVRSVNAR